MSGETLCFMALPGASPAPWSAEDERAAEDIAMRPIVLDDGAGPVEIEAGVLAPRLLPRLFHQPGSTIDARLIATRRLVVLLPIGRYDDGVWSPIVERILNGLRDGQSQAPAVAAREVVLAWTGIDPFLAPFGRRSDDIWHDPRLVPRLMSVIERSARSLSAVLRDVGSADDLAVRQGLIRFGAAPADGPLQATLVLA